MLFEAKLTFFIFSSKQSMMYSNGILQATRFYPGIKSPNLDPECILWSTTLHKVEVLSTGEHDITSCDYEGVEEQEMEPGPALEEAKEPIATAPQKVIDDDVKQQVKNVTPAIPKSWKGLLSSFNVLEPSLHRVKYARWGSMWGNTWLSIRTRRMCMERRSTGTIINSSKLEKPLETWKIVCYEMKTSLPRSPQLSKRRRWTP